MSVSAWDAVKVNIHVKAWAHLKAGDGETVGRMLGRVGHHGVGFVDRQLDARDYLF